MNQRYIKNPLVPWIGGIGFTFAIAALGYFVAFIPGFSYVGQLATAIIIAVIYRQIFGYPEALRLGIAFTAKYLLRTAIVLYGLKLNIDTVLRDGVSLLVKGAIIITVAILLMIFLSKMMKANMSISLLLGVGTGVCGAAAIAAVAPIVKAKDEDTAIGVGIIALMGTIFAIVYTILHPFLPFSATDYGIWSGLSLHELAHVALAAEPAGEDALAIALLAKLGRVFLLVPLCFIFIFIMKRKGTDETETNVPFPFFLLGFIALSLIGTYVIGDIIVVSQGFLDGVSQLTTWLLTAAMVGLGLNVSLSDVRAKAMKPLIAMIITSVVVSVLTIVML